MTSTLPEAFLLHGYAVNLGGVSALSMLRTALTKTLRQKNNFLAVTHFCGRNQDPEGRCYGGAAMMKGFVSQLILYRPFNTNGIQYDVDLVAADGG